MSDSLSLAQARRVALAAQGFGAARPATVGTRQLGRVLDRLGVLQIDSVNVLERSHYLPVFARLGGYDKALLDRLTLAPRARYLEYWAHVATFVPAADWPLWRWRMRDYRERHTRRPDAWANRNRDMLDWVRAELAANGPMPASAIEHDANVRRGPWWGWSDVKEALEHLFAWGEVTTAGRRGFERVYALPEQVLPAGLLGAEVPREEAQRELMARAARAHGVGTAGDLADYYRLPVADATRALRELEEGGVVRRVRVEGWSRPAFLHRDARLPRRLEAAALLSPFDPVVWERDRALRLFDFHYRIEIYTPAARRVYGYYTLPVLVDERLVGRVDLKNDRQAGALLVQSAWREPHAPAGLEERIAPELRAMAAWQGLERIEVRDRGDLARELAAALGVTATPPAPGPA